MSEQESFPYLTFPALPPEKLVGDFLRSKLELEALRIYPQWHVSHPGPIMKLVHTREELHETNAKLEKKQIEAIENRKYLDNEWNKLELEEEGLKQSFKEFDEMINQNIQKRERASKKILKQKFLEEKRDAALKELQSKYEKLIYVKETMECEIKKHMMYQEFLESVSENSSEFKTADDVFKKFEALDDAQNTITHKTKESLAELETTKGEILKLIDNYKYTIMGLNNNISQLYKRYTSAKKNAEKWEQTVKDIQVRCGEKYVEFLNVRKACWHLYLEMCKCSRIKPDINKSDIERQLCYIKQTMRRLKRTLELCQQNSSKEISSLQVENSNSK